MYEQFTTKKPSIHNEERVILQQWCKPDSHILKNETGSLPYTIYKNQLKMIKDLNTKPELTKLLEEITGEKLLDLACLSNDFWI